jgi:hypothetical protein
MVRCLKYQVRESLGKKGLANKEDDIIGIILGEDKKDYEDTIQSLLEIIEQISCFGNKTNQEQQLPEKNTKRNIYEKLIEEMNSVEAISIQDSKTLCGDTKALTNLKSLFEKLDSAGQKLTLINKLAKDQKKYFLIVNEN